MSDDPVLAALLAALESEDTPEVRAAVGRHLLAAGEPNQALAHFQQAMALNPNDQSVVADAARAARAAGNNVLADAYDAAGQGDPQTVGPPPGSDDWTGSTSADDPVNISGDDPGPEPVAVHAGAMSSDDLPGDSADEGDEYDAFLREVMAEEEANRIRLGDVGGLSKVKADLERRFFGPIRNPELQKAYGKPLNGGLLLYGPPGCGKTYLARAIAGELQANFLPVTLHDTLDMWLGNSEKQLHKIFSNARANQPTVLFIDEIDAIGQKRSRTDSASMRSVVAQLLQELDGATERNDGVFVIGATNAPWDVDPALRRPGRFDRTVLVLPPDETARLAILETHLRDRPVTSDLDVTKVAAKTAHFSGADLKLICDTAVELAMEQAFKKGTVVPVNQKLLLKAAKSVSPSVGPWINTARNFVAFANEDGDFDELAEYLASYKKR